MREKRLFSRRRFIQMASAIAAGTLNAACGVNGRTNMQADMRVTEAIPIPSPTSTSDAGMAMEGMSAGKEQSADFVPDVEFNLQAVTDEQQIFAGAKTRVWRYLGEVVSGDKNSLATVPGSYLGPVLVLKKGQKVRVNFINGLPEDSIIHWHGLHVPSDMDGLPHHAVAPGGKYVYEFIVDNRPGLYWFHPHPDMRTGFQAYQGLAGLVLITNPDEPELGLPSGTFDLPLVIQDRLVDTQNQWIYPNNMMSFMQGLLGNNILVNGNPNVTVPVAATAYRLRFLNGSNARIYRLAWEDGTPWTVIGTDGGLLEKPVQRPYLMLSPGERVEVWVDFSKKPVGSQVKLISQAFAGGTMQMMGGMNNSTLPNGAAFTVLTVNVDRAGDAPAALPDKLSIMDRLEEKDAVNTNNPRTFTLSFARMAWLMNGRTYEMGVVADDEIVRLNTTEAWAFYNGGAAMMGGGMTGTGMGGRMGAMVSTPMPGTNMPSGMGMGMGGMMNMPHVMHLHGFQFLIIDRQVDAPNLMDWQTVSEGLLDEGWKDTFLIMPGERVKFLVRFTDFTGLFMYHCHIIEHEDMGMMRFFRVDA